MKLTFSVLQRVKTYIRSTYEDDRLSCLMQMAVQKKLVKNLNIFDLVDDFGRLHQR